MNRWWSEENMLRGHHWELNPKHTNAPPATCLVNGDVETLSGNPIPGYRCLPRAGRLGWDLAGIYLGFNSLSRELTP